MPDDSIIPSFTTRRRLVPEPVAAQPMKPGRRLLASFRGPEPSPAPPMAAVDPAHPNRRYLVPRAATAPAAAPAAPKPAPGLSADQAHALDCILRWRRDGGGRAFMMLGRGGCGKTHVIAAAIRRLGLRPFSMGQFLKDGMPQPGTYLACAPTRRAASVLVRRGVIARTLASACYNPFLNAQNNKPLMAALERLEGLEAQLAAMSEAELDTDAGRGLSRAVIDLNTEIEGMQAPNWSFNPAMIEAADLVIVDEISLVSVGRILDLAEADGVWGKLLACGDHHQLPPLPDREEESDFAGVTVCGPINASVILEKVHRQAEGSDLLRLLGDIIDGTAGPGWAGEGVSWELYPGSDARLEEILSRRDDRGRLIADADGTLVVVDTHDERKRVNTMMRRILGRRDWKPVLGDVVVATANTRLAGGGGISNGDRMRIVSNPIPVAGDRGWMVDLRDLETGHVVRRVVLQSAHLAADYGVAKRRLTAVEVSAARGLPAVSAILPVFFGWSRTAHVSQGSSAGHVIVIGSWAGGAGAIRQWCYTAASRAEKSVAIYVTRHSSDEPAAAVAPLPLIWRP